MVYSAKDLRITPIDSRLAMAFIREHHYSGKAVLNSQVNLGVYLGASLEGAIQYGPPLDRNRMMNLVEGTKRENLLELNRMAFTERLPRNSESRALGVSLRLLRKYRPSLKWVVTFADATQCGDGTIYRASGAVLTDIKKSANLARFPSGEVIHKMTLESAPNLRRSVLGGKSYYEITGGSYSFSKVIEAMGAEVLIGYQLRYVYFLDPTWRSRLTVPEIPYSELRKRGISMYRGNRRDGVLSTPRISSAEEAGHSDLPAPNLP